MRNYYILSVDSFMNSFSMLDTSSKVTFEYVKSGNENVIDKFNVGDQILIYKRKPFSTINIYLEVTDDIQFIKKFEISDGISLNDVDLNVDLEEEEVISIDEIIFYRIMHKMLNPSWFENKIDEIPNIDDASRISGGENILFYGVPGAGKSHAIDNIVTSKCYERVVFHQDYTYSDFIGQIMPRLKKDKAGVDKLTYEFIPGPFTKALKKAVNDRSMQMQYLVIEEINRGNAPAIFGDIFQLLDRESDGSGKYSITNFDIAREVYNDEDHEIKIPSNLTILATMNTSDQNVFTLDTAFQRRWNMKYVKNNIEKAIHADCLIEHSKITWAQFAKVINKEIVEYNSELSSCEDKQLGAYFVTKEELSADKFAEKALKYLWDDAFKLEREHIFEKDINSIGDLLDAYDKEILSKQDPIKRVIKSDVYKKMMDMSANSAEEAYMGETEIFSSEPLEEE